MSQLRNRISYRRASKNMAPEMAEIRELFSALGDDLEQRVLPPVDSLDLSEPQEYARYRAIVLSHLEDASHAAISAYLRKVNAPIDPNPGELHYRAPETEA